jgi:ABC-type lipoprotein export system ATPase subunit
LITLESVAKSFGSVEVLTNLSLNLESSMSHCIIGRSGCGKSTLLKMMALIAKPDKGKITINGTDVTLLNEQECEKFRNQTISYSFQEPLLIPYMTSLENITEVLGIDKDMAIRELSRLGLSKRLDHLPSKLSVGEKKRVDIARAILKGSSILIADEPLSNLDPASSLMVMELLRAHANNGGSVIYSAVEPTDGKFADNIVNL